MFCRFRSYQLISTDAEKFLQPAEILINEWVKI